VLSPPWSRHRPLPIAGHRQCVPRRVRAAQRGAFVKSPGGFPFLSQPRRLLLCSIFCRGFSLFMGSFSLFKKFRPALLREWRPFSFTGRLGQWVHPLRIVPESVPVVTRNAAGWRVTRSRGKPGTGAPDRADCRLNCSHNPKVGGSNPSPATNPFRFVRIPVQKNFACASVAKRASRIQRSCSLAARASAS
jgi:hypothetical protein